MYRLIPQETDSHSVDSASSSHDDDRVNTTVEEDRIVDGCNLSEEVRLLNQNQINLTDAFVRKLSSRVLFSDQCCKELLILLGAKPFVARSKNCELIMSWINLVPVEKRKYCFMNKPALVNLCASELKGSKTSYLVQSKDRLMDLLAQPRVALPTQNVAPATAPTGAPSSLSDVLKKQILIGAFLKPLTGGNRQNTRIGLDNEVPLLMRLLTDSSKFNVYNPGDPNDKKLLSVSEIYRPGMVRKVGKEWVKSSIDALGVLQGTADGDEPKLIGIEVKTRCEESTRQPEIAMRMNMQRQMIFVKINYKM